VVTITIRFTIQLILEQEVNYKEEQLIMEHELDPVYLEHVELEQQH
jgi:hypothetical protein